MARCACRPLPPRPEGRGFSGLLVKISAAIARYVVLAMSPQCRPVAALAAIEMLRNVQYVHTTIPATRNMTT